MAYSKEEDLLLGNVPLPVGDKATRAVERAGDEMDGILGARYRVPINPTGPQQRQVRSLLLTINNWLASGRLIEELTASSQTVELHAYAAKLIAEAQSALFQIVSGAIALPGCELVGSDSTLPVENGPIIVNADDSSPTAYHYDSITNPLYTVQNPNEAILRGLAGAWPYPYVGGG